MFKGVNISLANKCQLLFGAAVLLILTAALTVVSWRMQALVDRASRSNARQTARAWLSDRIQFRGGLKPVDNALAPLPPDAEREVSLIEPGAFAAVAKRDAFFAHSIARFRAHRGVKQAFRKAADAQGHAYLRYARVIRASDRRPPGSTIHRSSAADHGPGGGSASDPIEAVLMINLRDREAAAQRTLNRVYTVAAGLFAGLLAIAVFWFITTRIILSPVRLLRGYAEKVSRGDLNIRSDINTGDEFEQLSTMFNNMLDTIKESQDRLRGVNKSLDLKLGELAQSNVALYEANKMKGEFLANVSHELRTPLNSIIGFAEVLEETLAERTGPVDEKRKRYAAHIITSSRRLVELINDLLDLAKIEAGRVELRLAPQSLADLAEGLVSLMTPQADKGGIQLKAKVQPGLPPVETDVGKLQQVLFNLLSNAIKFTPRGGSVTLRATMDSEGGDGSGAEGGAESGAGHVRLSVTDTGPGIAPADQERIFDKFIQLDPGMTRRHEGTGLGLTISRELARMLQGRLELRSQPGQGTTFTLVLPVRFEPAGKPLMPPAEGEE